MKQLSVLFMLFVLFTACKVEQTTNTQNVENIKVTGPVFGTSFSVIYNSETDYSKEFDSLFAVVNQSMSTYIPNSDISRLNRNEAVVMDNHFREVFSASKIIYEATQGAFDPTIGDVVNAWSFGADKNKFLTDSTTIDSLMRFVGFDKVVMNDNKVVKSPNTYIEFNAVAKGYAVDVIADFLDTENVQNYLVEIGGEIRAKGENMEKGSPWRVGLDEPRYDGNQSVYKAITIKDVGMATSGTYRKFKTDVNGNRYAHIINTKTGYPTKTNILSISVIAEDCMTADAYATAFQAMGIEAVSEFLKSHPELKVFMIFENDQMELETLTLNDFPGN
ncbi:thiamine biosynthesis lipoprotein [Formosa sp. Hel1_31_208]|uniref:FAD:protein FMN transferase n=1 Tax=Formosa sp. Hel1_31_208 TaxID=1798225 RepID=UPI0008793405|nr:FAD:protein FMN transferase [Formosa sp. Hel1_31_208]SDR93657.1 thiamine biosynthesis lipoprotein [Formosa sp. Hel1_31_208]